MAGKALKDVTSLCKCPACGQTKRMHYLCPHCLESRLLPDRTDGMMDARLTCCRTQGARTDHRTGARGVSIRLCVKNGSGQERLAESGELEEKFESWLCKLCGVQGDHVFRASGCNQDVGIC
jgi:ribosomal protein L32